MSQLWYNDHSSVMGSCVNVNTVPCDGPAGLLCLPVPRLSLWGHSYSVTGDRGAGGDSWWWDTLWSSRLSAGGSGTVPLQHGLVTHMGSWHLGNKKLVWTVKKYTEQKNTCLWHSCRVCTLIDNIKEWLYGCIFGSCLVSKHQSYTHRYVHTRTTIGAI